MKQTNNNQPMVAFDNLTDMATTYIIKYVDARFNPMYWQIKGRRGHGSIDYDEMPKVILHIMKEQLYITIPFILEEPDSEIMYDIMKEKLCQLPEKINKNYIDTHNIDIEEIRKDVSLTLFHTFKPSSHREVA